jgi:hypothetical protein
VAFGFGVRSIGMSRDTCGDCPHLHIEWMMNIALPGCGKTSPLLVVPHHMVNAGGGKTVATFWRVPEFCPLPDEDVKKSSDKAPQRNWVKRNYFAK